MDINGAVSAEIEYSPVYCCYYTGANGSTRRPNPGWIVPLPDEYVTR